MKWKKTRPVIAKALEEGDMLMTSEGIVFQRSGIRAAGHYHDYVNGAAIGIEKNLLPDAAILSILNVYFGSSSKLPAWYLALFAGALNPQPLLTAANFSATMTEITSNTEGYSEATRPQWTPAPAAGGVIGNLTNKSAFTIICTNSIVVEGAALLSNNIKGGTAGVLASCARFSAPRTLFNGDSYELGYTVSLSSD
jgi:hypothetical protein